MGCFRLAGSHFQLVFGQLPRHANFGVTAIDADPCHADRRFPQPSEVSGRNDFAEELLKARLMEEE
jgi:hypothetical protein